MGMAIQILRIACYGFALDQCVAWSSQFKPNDGVVGCNRRSFGRLVLGHIGVASSNSFSNPANASNLPTPTGADISRVATIEMLIPILVLRQSLDNIDQDLRQKRISNASLDKSIPRNEQEFKRIFDAYSDPVSYKQKFMDQNAFLVYYTKGFDGPGRSNIEEDINERQTQQFGLRNEAWIAWDNFLTELKFVDDDDNDCQLYLSSTKRSIDDYLQLAPKADFQGAKARLNTRE